jgi:hypothetical protein
MEMPIYFAYALIMLGISFIASVYLRNLFQNLHKDFKRILK